LCKGRRSFFDLLHKVLVAVGVMGVGVRPGKGNLRHATAIGSQQASNCPQRRPAITAAVVQFPHVTI
jgi:hypothetical protein